MIICLRTVFGAALALTLSRASVAGELWVSPTGVDAPSGRGSVGAAYATMAYACSRATTGDVVRLTAGVFRETAQTVLKSGVSILGNGATGSPITVVYAPSSWNYSADLWTDNVGGYVIRASDVQNCDISGIEFRMQGDGGVSYTYG